MQLKDRLRLNWHMIFYTQRRMAEVLGVPLSTYKSWEWGVCLPSLRHMKRVRERYPDLMSHYIHEKL